METNEIVLYQPNETMKLEVRLENETVWLTQQQIADLFGTKRPAITKHLSNIFKSGELEEESTCSILEHMAADGSRTYSTKYYNLDVILSVGYRVNSANVTMFRRWANQVLKEYLLRGYSVNQRLMQIEDRIDRRLSEHDRHLMMLDEKVDIRELFAAMPSELKADLDGEFLTAIAEQPNEILKCEMYLFLGYLDGATQFAQSCGGGGGDSSLPWGRNQDEDVRRFAYRCMM